MSRKTSDPARGLARVAPNVARLARAVQKLEEDEAALRPAVSVHTQAGDHRRPPLVELHGALELALVDRLVPAVRSLRRELAQVRRRLERAARKRGRS